VAIYVISETRQRGGVDDTSLGRYMSPTAGHCCLIGRWFVNLSGIYVRERRKTQQVLQIVVAAKWGSGVNNGNDIMINFDTGVQYIGYSIKTMIEFINAIFTPTYRYGFPTPS